MYVETEWKKLYHANQKEVRVAILISDKIDLRTRDMSNPSSALFCQLLGASSHRFPTWPTSRPSPTAFFMASLLCWGPKLAACGVVLGAWGVII